MMDPNILVLAKAMAKGNGSGGGADIDVTASVGQTIVVEEVDANGKPTKWKAADFQEKICGIGLVELLNTTLYAATENLVNITIKEGETYYVTFDGVEYTCVGTLYEGEEGIVTYYIGNSGIVGLDDSGEPFAVGYIPDYGVTVAAILNEAEQADIIVRGLGYTPIPVEYVSNAFPYYIDITGSGTDDDPYVCAESVANVNAIFDSGRPLVVRFTDAQHRTWHIPMVWGAVVSAGSMYYFYVKWAGSDISAKTFVLASQDDGTFAVSNKLSD